MYRFKALPELAWVVVVAVAVALATEFATFNADVLDDPRTWYVSLVGGAIRAAAGAALAFLTAQTDGTDG